MARKGLFAALEDEVIGAGSDMETVPQSELDAEVAVNEISEQDQENQDFSAAIEEASDAASDISDIAEVTQQSVDSGEGLSPEAAEIAEVAVESICNRLGMISYRRTVPSLESFGQKQSRLSATKVALEGFVDKVKEIWKKIIESIKTFSKKIKDFLFNFFNSVDKLKEYLKDLRTKALNIPASAEMKEKELKSSLAVELFGGVENVIASQIKFCTGYPEAVNALTTAGESIAKVTRSNIKDNPATHIQNSAAIIKKNLNGIKNLYDGYEISIDVKVDGDSVKIEHKYEQADEAKKADKINLLDKKDMLKVLTTSDELVNKIEQLKKAKDENTKVSNSLTEAGEACIKHLETKYEKDDAALSNIGKIRTMITSLQDVNNKLVTEVTTSSARAVKAAGKLVSASISNYETKDKEDKK